MLCTISKLLSVHHFMCTSCAPTSIPIACRRPVARHHQETVGLRSEFGWILAAIWPESGRGPIGFRRRSDHGRITVRIWPNRGRNRRLDCDRDFSGFRPKFDSAGPLRVQGLGIVPSAFHRRVRASTGKTVRTGCADIYLYLNCPKMKWLIAVNDPILKITVSSVYFYIYNFFNKLSFI